LPAPVAGAVEHFVDEIDSMSAMKTRFLRSVGGLTAVVTAALLSALVTLPVQAADLPSKSGIDAILKNGRSTAQPDFLPVDEAFQPSVVADGPDKLRIEWTIHDGYYLYKSRIKVASTSQDAQLGAPALPTGIKKNDEYFGEQEIYHDSIVGSVPVARAAGSALQLPVAVTYQGCAEAGLCYPPTTRNFTVSLPAGGGSAAVGGNGGGVSAAAGDAGIGAGTSTGATAAAARSAPGSSAARDTSSLTGATSTSASGGAFVSEQDKLATLIRDGNLLLVLATFFGIGVLLSFTPCVLPMIPILSGIIVGQGEKVTAGRGFSLAFTYVQGMALTYAAAGAAFVLAFKQAPQAFFQQPWIICLFAALFIALAFAMFGAYTLQLPSALQTRLTNVSNQQKSGTYVGTFIMGALSALVVTACVAPALIAALSVISQTGQIARGAGALYATGLGMGVPLLLVGASAGTLLPKVGPWMDTVKSLFGVLFLGVAIYFVQPLLSPSLSMLLWSALAVVGGYWIFSLKARDGGPAPAAVRAPGLIAVVYGILLLIGVASGGTDPLQPLGSLRVAANSAPAGETKAAESGLAFETIKSVADLQARVAAAKASGKTVMLDFYADWCVSCKEMEKYTFTDSGVQAALGNTVLLRADVTKNDDLDQALLQHLGILGPPTIAFYDAGGTEQRPYRVVGYMKAGAFTEVLRKAFGDSKPS
jgi:thioredoxin:protein disulfide reductase